MSHHIFLSYSSRDEPAARQITAELEQSGIRCWMATRDITAGVAWGEAIVKAIRSSSAVVVLISRASTESEQVAREIDVAMRHQIALVPVRLDGAELSRPMQYFLAGVQTIDAIADLSATVRGLLKDVLRHYLPSDPEPSPPLTDGSESASGPPAETPPSPPAEPSSAPAAAPSEVPARGYVFLSYVRSDGDFVLRLRTVLQKRGYAYWDYLDAERDYQGALYRELEERIDQAKAFISIVTDSWRKSDWIAAEYIYAKESRKPIFVVQAAALTRPMPILLNLQTRIDMSGNFEEASAVLQRQLQKKGL
ncbi:MAG: toll/interleukin-1 receptor domain-containing protein [Planctomycetaceae bacterium]|nr:toll/interleukin-1 receptor domain-containing protein [Planctomycetaceae bacterium]